MHVICKMKEGQIEACAETVEIGYWILDGVTGQGTGKSIMRERRSMAHLRGCLFE